MSAFTIPNNFHLIESLNALISNPDRATPVTPVVAGFLVVPMKSFTGELQFVGFLFFLDALEIVTTVFLTL